MTETQVRNQYRYTLQKIHKCNEHRHFLNQCLEFNLLPFFTRISAKILGQLNLQYADIQHIRRRNLENALIKQNSNLSDLSDTLEKIRSQFRNFASDSDINLVTNIFKNQIIKIECQNDTKRSKKLEKLKNEKIKNPNFEDYAKVEILNSSNKNIPDDILHILELGPDSAIGGVPKKTTILSEFELFFSTWSKYAAEIGLDLIKITEIKSLLFLEFLNFTKCTSDTKNVKRLRLFLKNNPDLIICLVDKSKNLAIFDRNDYLEKLDEIYDPQKFEKLPRNPLKTDLTQFKSLISEFSDFLSKSDKRLLDPVENTKSAYGLVKLHRENAPLRPIVSGRNCLTSGCEQYLLNLIQPILAECQYSISSTKKFKEKFCATKDLFNPDIHEVISYDASQLFTSINVKRTIKYIIRKIYRDTQTFFPISDETPLPPPKPLLEQLFLDVLLKYNSFQTLNGFYRQKMGVAMGGKLSAALSSIFVNIFEEVTISKYIKNNKVLFYCRYVDDCCVIIKKRTKGQLLKDFNNFDSGLKWTIENMKNNELIFLDTKIVLNDSTLTLHQYRKPSASHCLTNFKLGVSPKSYKYGLISGEVHRANNCTSSEVALNDALENLENILVKNLYPRKVVKQKMKEIKERNFGPSDKKLKRQAEINNPNFKRATICLPYTSFRCSTVASKIYKILKKYTPNFKLNISFSTIKLSSIIRPNLKPRTEEYLTSNVVYKFNCECSSSYIGHTKKYFEYRIFQHRRDSTSHVHKHISTCQLYNSTLSENYGSDPSDNTLREFLKTHFSILESKLYNYRSRITYEGLMITLQDPDLNKQVSHKSMTFVCDCANYKIENAVGT